MPKILIIEDVRPLRDAIAEVLRIADFTTLTAEDGVAGLTLAQENTPDLILCDIEMPRLDGYGVFEALQKSSHTATIPFVFMTSAGDHIDCPQSAAAGIKRLYKPFNPTSLVSLVKTQLSPEQAAAQV